MKKSISSSFDLKWSQPATISLTIARSSQKPRHAFILTPSNRRSLMSIPQVLFDPTRPYITIPTFQSKSTNRSPLHRNIRPSFPKNAHRVVDELNTLLSSQQQQSADASHRSNAASADAGEIWVLDSTCDAISRFKRLSRREDVVEMASQILDVAEQMNHHPSISVYESATMSGRWIVIATCATHKPAGLSVKDPRLALKIDEIAARYIGNFDEETGDGVETGGGADSDGSVVDDEHLFKALRTWHWRKNIGRALPSLDIAEEDSLAAAVESEEHSGSEEPRGHLGFWRLNTKEDIEAFSGHKKSTTASSNIPTMRRLIL